MLSPPVIPRFATTLFAVLCSIQMLHAEIIPVPSAAAARITVEVSGQGSDVVLIPGLASSRAVWDATVARLADHYRVHVVQVSGFAGQPAGANATGAVLQPTVDAIDLYIERQKLKSPAVIGHSLGGLMGLLLAKQHPGDVGRLMIVDALPFYGVLFGPNATVESIETRAAAMRDAITKQTPEIFAAMEGRIVPTLVKSPDGRTQVTAWAQASDRSVLGRVVYEDMTTDLRGDLALIKTPTVILYPWDAATGMPQAAFDAIYTDAYASMPNAKVKRIDGSFHFIMLDQPDAFAAEVESFLK